jgi:hypothetical protein
MAICPNKSTKEWKNLENHVGEFEAYRAYIAHGETIPNAVSMTELKRAVGLKGGRYSVQQQININRKIRKWNKENGTSHFVEYKRIGESETSTATLRFNYLPVNKQAQADRDKRRKMKGYVGLEDGESFENVWTPSESEQEAGRFEDGDFLPPSYFPASEHRKKGPKYQRYIEAKQTELTKLYTEKETIARERRLSESPAERRVLSKKTRAVEEKIADMEKNITALASHDRLDQIGVYAEEDMATLEAIFAKPQPTDEEVDIAKRLIHIWQQAGDFSGNNPHIFYDPDELAEKDDVFEEMTRKFEEWRKRADDFNVKLIMLQEKRLKQKIGETKGFSIEDVDFDKPIPDISFLVKNLLDISEVDHIVLQAVAKWVKDANFAAKEDLRDSHEKLEELIKATGLKDFGIFQQTVSNTDPRLTGDMVNKYSQSYFDWKYNLRRKRESAIKSADKIADEGKKNAAIEQANREFVEEMQKNSLILDPRILFYDAQFMTVRNEKGDLVPAPEPTAEQKKAHEDELRELLGDVEYEKQYKIAKENIELFKEDYEAFIDHIEGNMEGESDYITNAFIDSWVAHRSPYVFGDLMQHGYDNVKARGLAAGASTQYIQSFPRQVDKEGKDTGFYDEKFKQIEGDQDLQNLYTFIDDMLQEMKSYLPSEQIAFMRTNSIPTIRKKILDEIFSNGSEKGFSNILRERISESVRMTDLSDVGKEEETKNLQLQMLVNNRGRVNQYVQLKDTEYRANNEGEAPSMEQRSEWRKDIIDIIAKEKSFDLGRVMKAFSAMAVTYKHKSAIEDQIRTAQDIIQRSLQARQNLAGDQMRDKNNNLLSDKGLKNLNDMFENFLDVAFWGYASNIPEGRMDTRKKSLNKTEKELMATLETSQKQLDQLLDEEKIDQGEYDARSEVIREQMEVLGGVRAYSKYGDILLKYVQYKGMGWNIYAAFSNIGFGLISNIIEASDGRNYSMKSYRKAQAMIFNSVLKNGTFNLVETGTAKKIRALMNRFDVLKESRTELYKTTEQKLFARFGKKVEWASPFNPQSRSEYFNQAPIMIAMMMDTQVTNEKGETVSMWDKFDEDGNFKEGEETTFDEIADLKNRIDQVVKMNHGNYDPDKPLGAKRKFIGRAASQFRTWAFQGFAERFRKEFRDNNLTNIVTGEDYLNRKGRYRSYVAYFHTFDNLGAVRLPINMTIQLLRKLVGRHTTFENMVSPDSEFTEVDAANMRKNMTEVVLALILMSVVLALKHGLDDDDDDSKAKKIAYNLMINQMGRLATDIFFYTSPMEFERLSRNALPIFSLVLDAGKLVDSAGKLIFQGQEEDILQSGPDKGKSRTWRDFQKLIPGPVQVKKIQSAANQVYKKD